MAEVKSGRWLRRRGLDFLHSQLAIIFSSNSGSFCWGLGLAEDGAGGMPRLNEEEIGGA